MSKNIADQYFKKYDKDINCHNMQEFIDCLKEKYGTTEKIRWVTSDGKIETRNLIEFKNDIIKFSKKYLKEKRNEHIAILSNRNYECFVAIFSVLYTGNVVILVDIDAPIEVIEKNLKKADTSFILVEKNLKEKYENIFKNKYQHVLYEYKDFENETTIDFHVDVIGENEGAIILFTSGTTKENKTVLFTHNNVIKSVLKCARIAEVFGCKKFYSILPLNHALALETSISNLIFNTTLDIGTDIYKMPKELDILKSDLTLLPPIIVKSLYGFAERVIKKGGDFPIKVVVCGGAKLDDEIVRNCQEIGICVAQGYGTTECFGPAVVNPETIKKIGSVGLPISDIEIKIVENEILLKGPVVANSYYKDTENTKENFDGEWFKTGDLGYIDEDGFLYITGRKKNIIVLPNGENVAPEELEEKLEEIKYIQDAMIYEKKLVNNNVISAMVYIGNVDKELVKKEVEKINETLVSYKKIKCIEFSKEPLKRTLLKKICRKQDVEIIDTIIL